MVFEQQVQLNLISHATLAHAATTALTAAGPAGRLITIVTNPKVPISRTARGGYIAVAAVAIVVAVIGAVERAGERPIALH